MFFGCHSEDGPASNIRSRAGFSVAACPGQPCSRGIWLTLGIPAVASRTGITRPCELLSRTPRSFAFTGGWNRPPRGRGALLFRLSEKEHVLLKHPLSSSPEQTSPFIPWPGVGGEGVKRW